MQLDEIQETLLQIYHKNLQNLQLYDHGLYEKVISFEKMDKEEYFIDFKESRFELSNIDGISTYNCDPFYDADYRVSKLSQVSSFSLIKDHLYVIGIDKYPDHINTSNYLNEFIKKIDFSQIEPLDIAKKFVFIGTLLGVHINYIHRKVKANSYLIVEPNLEIFRLSLFLCDYSELFESSKLFFAIGKSQVELRKTLSSFLAYQYQYNHFIPFETASINYSHIIEDINILLLDLSPMIYPFSEYLVSLSRGTTYLRSSTNGIIKLKNTHDLLSSYPILYLGAGPSLAKELEWIYINQDKVIIVASAAVLKRLELLSIVPDIIVVIDGQRDAIKRQFDVDSKLYQDSIIFASVHIDEEIFALLNSSNLYLTPSNIEFVEDIGVQSGVTVGDVGVDLLLRLGAKELYLLGFDMAIKEDGKTHDGLHSSSKVRLNLDNSKSSNIDYNTYIFWQKGNHKDTIPTTMLYRSMLESMEEKIANFSDINIYNLSSRGAYIDGTKPTYITKEIFSKFKSLKKVAISNQIKIDLNKIVKSSFSTKDISYFKKEQKLLKKLQKSNNFLKSFYTIYSAHQSSISLQIIDKYLELILAYLDITQDQELFKIQIQEIISRLLLATKS